MGGGLNPCVLIQWWDCRTQCATIVDAMADKCHQRVRVGARGRIAIPAQARREIGIKDGDALILRVEDGRLLIEKPEQILKRLQDRVSESLAPGISLVEELLAERQEGGRREEEEPLQRESETHRRSVDDSAE